MNGDSYVSDSSQMTFQRALATGQFSSGLGARLTIPPVRSTATLGKWLFLVVLLTALATWQAIRWMDAATGPASQSGAMAMVASLPPEAQIALDDPQAKLDMPEDKARQINAAVPISMGEIVAARPYLFSGLLADRDRATSCLAAAVFYEAGDDRIGQQAVAQVVLNRARHPLYPNSVCGVVFQGSERKTGCQFTFTCDGSMARRRPSSAQWQRARAVAGEALSGFVYAPVGLATHYHTNWVVPYWSNSLDKIAQVGTHLFFRWRGAYGKPAVFAAGGRGAEILDPRLAALTGTAPAGTLADNAPAIAIQPFTWSEEVPAPPVIEVAAQMSDNRLLRMDANASPASIAATALRLCQGKMKCQVFGYVKAAPNKVWATAARADFYYDGGSTGSKLAYWNCHQFARPVTSECLPGTGSHNSTAIADAKVGTL